MLAFSAGAFAQATATSNAYATIITPIAITNDAEMYFGNIAVNNTAGTVVLATDDSRTVTGGCTLPAVTGTVNAAAFTITGETDATFTITVNEASITLSGPGTDMTVNNWTLSLASPGTLTGGTQNLTVGATLNVGASQAAGDYVSGTPFSVTVNYN